MNECPIRYEVEPFGIAPKSPQRIPPSNIPTLRIKTVAVARYKIAVSCVHESLRAGIHVACCSCMVRLCLREDGRYQPGIISITGLSHEMSFCPHCSE